MSSFKNVKRILSYMQIWDDIQNNWQHWLLEVPQTEKFNIWYRHQAESSNISEDQELHHFYTF